MTEEPLDLDKHRGMAAQKATDLRRTLMEVENNARELRDRQAHLESQLLSIPAAAWPEAAAKARYILTLGFDERDQARMRELAESNQEGAFEPKERDELQNYVYAGHMLALLHSKARRSLKASQVS